MPKKKHLGPDSIHVYPTYGKGCKTTHKTTKSRACWCEPEYMQLCPQVDPDDGYCLGGDGNCPPTCFRCAGRGLVRYQDPTENMLIIHRDGQLTRGRVTK